MSPELERDCHEGLEALDDALHGRVPPQRDPIAGATRAACRVRDWLILLSRQGNDVAALLHDANVVVSELVAGEFPVSGFRRKRIEKARELFASLVERAHHVARDVGEAA